MASSSNPVMTCDEFQDLASTLGPCELLDGEVRSLPFGDMQRCFVISNICLALGRVVEQQRRGYLLLNVGLRVRDDLPRVRGADIAYISHRRLPRPTKGFLTIAPELAVEVLRYEGSWQDADEKIEDYHALGVNMVWVADPHTRTVKLFPLGGEPKIVHDGEQLDGGAILPGFSVAVAEFFDE